MSATDPRRQFWLDDAWAVLGRTAAYVDAAMLMASVDDLTGLDRAIEQAVLQLKLARAARNELLLLQAEEKAAAPTDSAKEAA